jgi:hypothetical protein
VSENNGRRVQKFTANGTFLDKWGAGGTGEGEFDRPGGIAIDTGGNVYVADEFNHRIQKFTSDGAFLSEWGSEGAGDGQFDRPWGIAIDEGGNVYVADRDNHRVQVFNSDGAFINKWERRGSGEGEFEFPGAIATDGIGNIFVADTENHRIQKLTTDGTYVSEFGEIGSDLGMLGRPVGVAVGGSGKIYVTEIKNNRVQVFSADSTSSPSPSQTRDKAIIVAGGGAFAGNNIWDATQMCANFAYRALTYQGYTKDTIYYLSSDTDLDLDGNGLLDDVDAAATNSNFQSAITSWAQDAENLLIYATDHGGNGTFRTSETEVLQASTLNSWLDTIQNTIPGEAVVVYDACRSGSFVDKLIPAAGKERIVLTSTSPDEEAIFCNQGSISFSYFFWGRFFNGDSFYDSYVNARNSLVIAYDDKQHPLIEGNGNGIADESGDKDAARQVKVGKEIRTGGGIPTIGSVSPAQTLNGQTSATIYAADVIDEDGISRVWAVITPPDYSPGSPDNPVTDLPMLELNSMGANRYEGTYASFSETGAYNVAIYAADAYGIMSLPVQTTVTKEGSGGDTEPIPLNVVGFTTDLSAPPPTETPVEIVFNAQGESENPYYRYYQASGYQTQNFGNWQRLKDWAMDNSLTWFPYDDDHYILVVHVTDDSSYARFHQAGLSIETSGNSANPIQITSFTTNITYPQSNGVAITLSTAATGGSGQLYYRYYCRKLPDGQWTELIAYNTTSTGIWTPAEDGWYVVVVHVTDNVAGNTFSTAGMTCTIGQ